MASSNLASSNLASSNLAGSNLFSDYNDDDLYSSSDNTENHNYGHNYKSFPQISTLVIVATHESPRTAHESYSKNDHTPIKKLQQSDSDTNFLDADNNEKPKFMYELGGIPVINHVIQTGIKMKPKKILVGIDTKPAAGVMATRPTTAPIQAPIADTFLP